MLWQGGAVVDLGNLGGTGALAGHHACALNNRGQVVGHSDLTGDMAFHGFLWTWETGMRDIGTLPGDVASIALGISDKGVIVGVSLDSKFNPRAIVFENGAMTDLNAVVSSNPQKLYLLFAESINAHGQIVGLAATSDGDLHGFLATPDTAGTDLAAFQSATSPVPSDDVQESAIPEIRDSGTITRWAGPDVLRRGWIGQMIKILIGHGQAGCRRASCAATHVAKSRVRRIAAETDGFEATMFGTRDDPAFFEGSLGNNGSFG